MFVTFLDSSRMYKIWKDVNFSSLMHGGGRGVDEGARGVIVIVAGYGHGDTSSNPGPDWLHFTSH